MLKLLPVTFLLQFRGGRACFCHVFSATDRTRRDARGRQHAVLQPGPPPSGMAMGLSHLVILALVGRASCFSPSADGDTRHYSHAPPHTFHFELQKATGTEEDGRVVVFLDKRLPEYAEHERAFNAAAERFRCTPPGGVHALVISATSDERASFFAADLRVVHNLPPQAVPPVAVYYKGALPIGWISATHAAVSDVAAYTSANTSAADADASTKHWTAHAIASWAFSMGGIDLVRTPEELAQVVARAPRLAAAFFPSPCDGDRAQTFQNAVILSRSRNKILPMALSTNMSLSTEACAPRRVDVHLGGVCAIVGRARMTMPKEVPPTSKELAEWLEGIVLGGEEGGGARDEL